MFESCCQNICWEVLRSWVNCLRSHFQAVIFSYLWEICSFCLSFRVYFICNCFISSWNHLHLCIWCVVIIGSLVICFRQIFLCGLVNSVLNQFLCTNLITVWLFCLTIGCKYLWELISVLFWSLLISFVNVFFADLATIFFFKSLLQSCTQNTLLCLAATFKWIKNITNSNSITFHRYQSCFFSCFVT